MRVGLKLSGSALAFVLLAASAPPAGPSLPELKACFADQAAKTPFQGIVAAGRGEMWLTLPAGTIDGTTAPTSATPYRLASVGKVFTQVAIGQLVDAGRVSFDAPIGTYLPGLPPALAAVTVDQLIHHTGGVASGTLFTPDSVATINNARNARDLLPLVVNEPLAFAPGTQARYSNGGYFLLGAIIEAVSGRNYADYLTERVFSPLGMKASSLAAPANVAPTNSSVGPPLPPGASPPRHFVGIPDMAGNPAGDAVSTADDLMRFGRALSGTKVLSEATKARLFAKPGGVPAIGQAGGRPGANTFFMAYPDTGWVVAVLTNYDPPAGELMGEALGGLLRGKGCAPLSAADRPARFQIIRPPRG